MNNTQGAEKLCPLRQLFLFVGADPETAWLKSCGVAFDSHGFVVTGHAPADSVPGHAASSRECTAKFGPIARLKVCYRGEWL